MLAGLEQPSEGEIRIDGRRMNDLPAHERDTPLVWQSLALFPFLNVRQNVEFGLRMRGVDGPERRRRAVEWLERMGLKGFEDRRIDQLSGGQRQRVALARSLVTEPEMLLLDEPLSALDAHLVIRMQGVLTRLQRELGITFVYVTHSQSEAFAMADRVVIMGHGEIAQIGPAREVYRSPASRFVARRDRGCRRQHRRGRRPGPGNAGGAGGSEPDRLPAYLRGVRRRLGDPVSRSARRLRDQGPAWRGGAGDAGSGTRRHPLGLVGAGGRASAAGRRGMSGITWPNGARCAAAITFDMDADSLIHVAAKDGWRRGYPVSMGRYGPTVAIPRIVETYRRLGLKQSFFIPGWCLETYPRAVEAILKGGHEIGCHGWIHENPLKRTREEQAQDLDRALGAFDRVVGVRPGGYRAPVYQVTEHTVDLLLERGFVYESSMMADDVPYLLRAAGGDLVVIPPHWGTDDWPPFAHYEEIGYMMPVRGPSEGLAPFFEEFEAAYETGGFWMAVLHPFLTGRLARWRVMERWLEGVMKRGDVWFATLGEIAAHVLAERDRGADVRVEDFPYYTERQR
jgi:ABC-type nitrate/sulfonate/bicarbonate transport system ATPase subunit/peptidoglycan/xylan/chitin deacetylase (PgdA/CDA1 family)